MLPLTKMPSGKPNRKSPPRRSTAPHPVPHEPQLAYDTIDPRWLVKALGLTIVAAVFCAWLALCGLYYQGSWQLVLHPSRAVEKTPSGEGMVFEPIRFDATETGQPRLTGWWIPAEPTAPEQGSARASGPVLETPPRYAPDVVLYLHSGSGSLSDTLGTLKLLHGAGINLFAIDYRGFGQSDASAHPSSKRMAADSEAALDYLVNTRHIATERIVPYGVGLGAAMAAHVAETHPGIPAVILDNPDPDPAATAVGAHSSHLVPIRLIFHEHFDAVPAIRTLHIPKLLLVGGPNARTNPTELREDQAIYAEAASPSLSVSLPLRNYEADYRTALTRFLDQYLPPPAAPR